MLIIFLSFILQINSPQLSISVSIGNEDLVPSTFTPLNELEHLVIRTSYWARVDIMSNPQGEYILQGGKSNLKKISFYNAKGEFIGTGNHIKISLNNEKSTYYLFYPFVDEKDGNLLSIALKDEIRFLKERSNERVSQLAFHSFLAFPLFVAIVLALRTRSSVYLYYALYILSIMCFFGYQYGVLGDLLPIVNIIPPMWIWLFSFLLTFFYLLFSISFLDLDKFDPFSAKLIRIANWYVFIFFLISLFLYLLRIDVQHSLAYKIPFWIIQVILIVWLMTRIFKHPSSIKMYYLTGFFILCAVSVSGQILSASQSVSNYNYLFQLGLIVEVFILALGLSARVDEMQNEKTKAQNDLIDQLKVNEELQLRYTDELEQKVMMRTEALSKRNEENEVLLKEVHHRVKNNLQMITSMLSMRERRTKSKDLSTYLTSTRNKIKSMALIHEHLYLTSDFSSINLSIYIDRLCEMIIGSLHKGNEIDLRVSIQDLSADIETAIPLGLMINELITNSIKYGIADVPKPILGIEITEKEGCLSLLIFDNGEGISSNNKEGLGFTIIRSIIENMDGSIQYKKEDSFFYVEVNLREYSLSQKGNKKEVL